MWRRERGEERGKIKFYGTILLEERRTDGGPSCSSRSEIVSLPRPPPPSAHGVVVHLGRVEKTNRRNQQQWLFVFLQSHRPVIRSLRRLKELVSNYH